MGWCLLRGESTTVRVNVVAFRFSENDACYRRAGGTVTIETRSDGDRAALIAIARSREAVVLERLRMGAIEMRLARETSTDQTIAVPAVTYEWEGP